MTDWADEIANEMYLVRPNVASALRRAKADGMREAAAWCDEQAGLWHRVPDSRLEQGIQRTSAEILRTEADKIEKGETKSKPYPIVPPQCSTDMVFAEPRSRMAPSALQSPVPELTNPVPPDGAAGLKAKSTTAKELRAQADKIERGEP